MTTSAIDASTPEAILAAIEAVNATPGLRIKPGYDALLALFHAPNFTLPLGDMEQQFNMSAHFGWFCRRVAEHVGDAVPAPYALVNQSRNPAGGAPADIEAEGGGISQACGVWVATVIPMHGGDMPTGTYRVILRQLGLTDADLED